MLVFVGEKTSLIYLFILFLKSRVKLQHIESVHDQLFEVGSRNSIAFERKYGLTGPVPESLTNYLDVRQKPLVFSTNKFFFRLNIMVILVLVHQLKRFVLYSSTFV
jgi:hypothetical protein